jgi:RNA-directed DNA polymerase
MEVRLADITLRSGEPTTWGSGQRKLNCSKETWAPYKGRIRPSMQREEPPTMATGLERIAAKARCEPKLRFTSLAHHITKERIWENLCQIPKDSAPGVDGQTVPEAKENFGDWIDAMLQSVHRQGYQAPNIRRVYIPKPGKQEKRPLGVPCVADRALQRSAAQVLSAIYEQDFLPCSFGGRPGRGAHQALATLHEVIAGRKVEWVLEADLKNFFGSLSHEWMLRFVEHRVGDPRLISLIRRWLKAGILEDGEVHPNEEGTPQGGSISVLLSNLYLHYTLDLWFERVVKPRLRGEAYLVRYIDDFVLCFQYRADALRVQDALRKRLGKFGLTLEPRKTKLVEFGRFAQKYAGKRGRKRPETIYFLGFTLYCTRNQKGNFRVGLRTEKSRMRRALMRLQDQMRRIRHDPLREQVEYLNQMLRGHYAYYGIAGNFRALQRVHRAVERYWRKMLSSRSWKGQVWWKQFHQIKARFPLLRPKLYLPYTELQAIATL